MIIFERIKIKNFFSVGNTPIEIQLNSHRKTLIQGSNGSCKSGTILDSIVFGLFGKPYRKINKNNVINSINKGDTLIEIWFTISSKKYKVVRGLKPNIFEIYCDDKLINQDSKAKDYQDYFEKCILRTNYKSFTNTVILGSARYNPFMTLSPADRREIIEDLLDIQVFSTMNILVKDKLSKIKEKSLELKYAIELVQEKIKLQLQNIEDNKQNIKIQIESKQSEIDKSNEHINSLRKDIELIQKHVDVLQKKISDKYELEKRKTLLMTYETKIETSLRKVKKEYDFYDKHDACPTCKQSIDKKFKTEQFSALQNKLEELKTGNEKLQEEMDKLHARHIVILDIISHIQDHNAEIVKHNASITAINAFINKELRAITHLNNVQLETNDEKLKALTQELDYYKAEQDELVLSKKYYDYASVLLKDGGIKTKIIKQYIPVLNKLINSYLAKFNFFVNFNIDENFNEVIKSRYRDDFAYSSFSEGEKLRIDLSLLFAFRQIAKMKNSVNTNLLIMDEILDSALDAEGIEHFFELLDFAFDVKTNIFVISHKGDSITSNFDRILKFTKKKNFTRIEEIS